MNRSSDQKDSIWKALADPTRRQILDVLAERPQTSGEITGRFQHLCRTNVMKHLDVLVKANLVIIRREGRLRWNYLNPVPIQRVCDRWVSKHVKHTAAALSRLKDHVEEREASRPKTGQSAGRKNRDKMNPEE